MNSTKFLIVYRTQKKKIDAKPVFAFKHYFYNHSLFLNVYNRTTNQTVFDIQTNHTITICRCLLNFSAYRGSQLLYQLMLCSAHHNDCVKSECESVLVSCQRCK